MAIESMLTTENIIWLANNPLFAMSVLIAYIQYSLRYGIIHDYFDTQEGIVAVQIAMAKEMDRIDEDAALERLNEDDSANYIASDVKSVVKE